MRRKGLNIPTGEIKGHETPKLSKEEAIAAYLEALKQSKKNKDEKAGFNFTPCTKSFNESLGDVL